MHTFPEATHTTSSLAEANNDTGRTAFCGPYVLSAITGFPISKIEDVIRDGAQHDAQDASSKAPGRTRCRPRSPSSATR